MKRTLKVLVSLILVAAAIYFLDVQAMIKMATQGSASNFVVAIAINILAFLIMGVRWYRLIITRVRLPLLTHLGHYFRSAFLNTFTPANLGGDAYRLAALKGDEISGRELVKLLLRERLMGFYGYIIVFMLAYGLVLMFSDTNVQLAGNPYIYGVMVGVAAFILPMIARPMGERVTSSLRYIVGAKRFPSLEPIVEAAVNLLSPKGTFILMVLTFSGILLWIISIQVVAQGFGVSISLLHIASVATLVEIVRLVPITIQGVGLREGIFAYLMSYLGHNPEQCYVVGAVAYLALSASIVLCGPIGQIIMWRQAKEQIE